MIRINGLVACALEVMKTVHARFHESIALLLPKWSLIYLSRLSPNKL